MLSCNVLRALTVALFALVIVSGCTVPPSAVENPRPDIVIYDGVQQWLKLQQDVAAMDAAQLDAALADKVAPESGDDLYYHALLQQQSQNYTAWVKARDAFRQLHEEKGLTESQRQLADIFQAYNQLRINGHQHQLELLGKQASLQQQLHKAAQDKLLLEQKIQALTELEADISTRREE